ncbi:MAG: GatB/YqeY domain-containing protein [Anaerolineales bacterium]|jgi:hypothetical protein
MNPTSTKQQLTQALKDAMRAKDDLRKSTIRLAMAAIKNAEIERRGELDEPTLLGILQKEVKLRRETIDEARRAGRDELVAEAEAEIAVLEQFLPQPLTQMELENLAREVITEVGADSPRQMGQVMKNLMPRIQGRADGKQASLIVQRLLRE